MPALKGRQCASEANGMPLPNHKSKESRIKLSGLPAFAIIIRTSYSDSSWNIQLEKNAKNSSFTDCRFVGNYPNHGNICVASESADTYITRCQFLFNRTSQRGSGFVSRGRAYASHCTFVSCSRSLNNGGNVIFFWTGANTSIENSTFTRCFEHASAAWGEYNYGGSGNIVASEGGSGSFINCVFTNNLSMALYTYGSPLFAISAGIVRNCVIANNRYEVKPHAGRSYALFGNALSSFNCLIEGTTFAGNTIAAPAVEAASGSYALGILGHGNNNVRYAVLNCTFDSNRAEAAPVAGVTPILSRALLSTAAAYGSNAQMGVANCTFAGPVATGCHEIVQFGDFHSYPLTVLNSLFTRAGEDCEPFRVANPEQFIVRDCNIKDMHYPPSWLDAAGIEPDDPPLAPLAVLPPGSVPVRQVTVRLPGIRDTADIATNHPAVFPPLFRYRLRGSSTWVPLLPAANSGLDGSTPRPIPDACGNGRAFGSYTRGAVQPMVPAAETGVALVLRAAPPSGGTFSTPPGHAQTVATNAAITPVTALPAANASFQGWYSTNGTLYSASATLTINALGEDTLLMARFGTPEVALTFDLGIYGTFDANGSSVLTTNVPSGTVFPGVPAFTADPAWFVEGWSPILPEVAPDTDATYTAQAVSTALRILHVVPAGEVPAGSDNSGSSWENACGDFAAAYADAGRYRGEVWLRQGRYLLTAPPVPMLPNVTVRGGFAGTESDASQADPATRLSILTGDVNGDTYWRPNGNDPGTGNRTNIWSGLTFNRPNPGGGADYWSPNGNSGDDTPLGFLDSDGGLTNVVFDGVVFTCFRTSALDTGSGSDAVLTRCRIYACNTGKNNDNSALECSGPVLAEDSEFIGNWRAITLSSAVANATNVIRACLFEENAGYSYGAGIRTTTAFTLIEGCRFFRNAGISESWRCSASLTFTGSSSGWVNDCRFEENRVRGNCHGNVILENNGTFVLTRCAFLRNSLVSSSDRSVHSACIMTMNGNVLVRDSLFEANLCSVSHDGTDARAWSPVYCTSGGSTTFLNTTFRNNSAAATGTGKYYCGTFALNSTWGHLALVHCTVTGSQLNENAYEIININGNNATTLAIINSVVHSSAPAYKLFSVPAVVTLCLADSSITGVATNTLATGSNGYLYNVTAADARLAAHPQPVADGVFAQGISAASPFARAGRPVWLANDGYLYLHDPVGKPTTPWRRIVNKGSFYATVSGLALDSAPVPDAQDVPRLAGRIAYGPLNAPQASTLLLVR